jgi:hypothetical protein
MIEVDAEVKADMMKNYLATFFKRQKQRPAMSNWFRQPGAPSGLFSDLRELSGSLATTVASVEHRFLNLGESLQVLYADADRLAKSTIASVEAIGSMDDEKSSIRYTDTLVKDALNELKSCRIDISNSLRNIDSGLDQLGKLCTICSVIEKTGVSLNVVGLNIAVESSRSLEARDSFGVFSQEIRGLSSKISEISKNILEDSSRTRSEQLTAQSKIKSGLKQFDNLHTDAEQVVRSALDEIQSIMQLSKRIFDKANQRSQAISDLVGEVVVAIQFHDISRQKIEHIVMALEDIQRIQKGEFSEITDKNFPVYGCTHKILEIQAAQLQEVISGILIAHDKCRNAFDGLVTEVESLVKETAVFSENESADAKLKERIESLKVGMDRLSELMNQGRKLDAQTGATTGRVADTAAQLSEYIDEVRNISRELHLKALNAIVKSDRLKSEGYALEILAQEVSRLSIQSNGFVSDVVDILQSLVAVSLDLELDLESAKETDIMPPADIDHGGKGIAENYERCREDAVLTLEKSQALKTAVLQTKDELFFLSDLAESLNGLLTDLHAKTAIVVPWIEKNTVDAREQIDRIASRYTMDSERLVHHRHLGKSDESDIIDSDPISPVTKRRNKRLDSPREATLKSTDEDLGDNVELF